MKKILFVLIFSLFAVNSFAATIISPIVATANVNTANYALDAANLAAQPATYYTNASNLDAGTIANARVSGNYTNFTGLTCSGTVTSSIFSATTVNSTNAVITTLAATTGTITTLGSTTGTITNLTSTAGTINSLVAPTLASTTGAITDLTATTSTINTLVAPTITSTTAINGVILTASTATINTLVAPTLTSTTGTVTNLASSAVSVNGTTTSNWFVANDMTYGEIASSYNATVTTIAAQNTYYTVTANNFSVQNKNCAISTANGTITVLKAGKYWVTARVSGLSGSTNDVIHIGVSVNGGIPLGYYESEFTLLAASGKGGQSYGGIISLNANDTVSTLIENTSGANNVTIKFYNLSLFRLMD